MFKFIHVIEIYVHIFEKEIRIYLKIMILLKICIEYEKLYRNNLFIRSVFEIFFNFNNNFI